MTDYEFWKDLGNIFTAVLDYQRKNVEFNNRFINPWIRLGNIFETQDRKKEAVDAYRHAAEIDPQNAQCWSDLGDACFRINSYEEAIAAYRTAVSLDPQSGWPLCNLALTLTIQGKVDEAIPLYKASVDALAEEKDKAVAWNRLGNAYRKLNDYENAFIAFQQADRLDNENTGFRDTLDELPEGATDEMVVLAPDETLEQMASEALVAEETPAQSEVEAPVAEETLVLSESEAPAQNEVEESVAEETPVVSEVEAPVAEETLVVSEVEAPLMSESETPVAEETLALSEVEAPLMSESEAPVAEETLAASEVEAPVAEVVEQTMDAVAEETPVLSEVEAPVQEVVEAVAPVEEPVVMETETQNDPTISTTPLSTDVVETYTELPSAQVEVAPVACEDSPVVVEADAAPVVSSEAAYDEYLKDSAVTANSVVDIENMYANQPATQVSENGEVRIEMDTRNAHVWNELGNVYLNAGAYDDAVVSYGKAIELDNQFAWPYSNLALAYVHKERFAEAILLYQRSIELFKSDKDKAVTWNRLGNVYRRLNDYDHAIEAYQTADELDPNNTMLSLRSRFGLLGSLNVEQIPNLVA